MVIFIGAESATGKTLMAQRLLETLHIPYLSCDHLKMGLYRANPNCGFAPSDANTLIEKQLWPILKGIVDTVLENEQHLMIEGAYLLPARLAEFTPEQQKQIIPVFMGFSKHYLDEQFASQVLHHRDVIERRTHPEDRSPSWFIIAHAAMKNRCHAAGVRYFEIDEDYQRETDAIVAWVSEEAARIRGTFGDSP